jgi:hypothetical protein
MVGKLEVQMARVLELLEKREGRREERGGGVGGSSKETGDVDDPLNI